MKFFDRLRGVLVSAFPSPKPDVAPPIPKYIAVPLGHISNHVLIKTTQTGATEVCRAKWKVVSDTMYGALNPFVMNMEHRNFIGLLNDLRATMRLTNAGKFVVQTQSLLEVYNNRHIFDEIVNLLPSRDDSFSNVACLPGVAMPSTKINADMIMKFKAKFVQMMEMTMGPYLGQDCAKETAQAPQPQRERAAPWISSGQRPL